MSHRDSAASPAPLGGAGASHRLSPSRRRVFLAITILLPFALLAAAEGLIRLIRPDGGLPLFVKAQFVGGDYLVANPRIGSRWFAGIDHPPAPAPEMFAAKKPDRTLRVFVLGESAAAGFPYPRNVMFSRYLRDVLRDALPADSVEVVNLGIAATNTFAMLDIAGEVADQNPDAVLIYAGHNEYYGVLGAASRVATPGGAGVRVYLRLLRLRIVLAMRNAVAGLRRRGTARTQAGEEASLMEVLARDRQIPLRSAVYDQGARQFENNLEGVVRVFRKRGVPVFLGSVASNLRDQRPFASAANSARDGADSVFAAAQLALFKGDTTAARLLYSRARDLDVVRFRAPGEFNDIIRRVGARSGATYVPVAETFAAASPAGIPGANLFLEHVHPTRRGQALIGQTFFDAMVKSGVLGNSVAMNRVRPVEAYIRGMDLTPFDERIAIHITRTITSRWPFVQSDRQLDYRGQYVPVDLLDSLAFAVSRGDRWEVAKLRLAAAYERKGQFDSAAAEYAGLVRDAPLVEEPLRLLARSLGLAGHPDSAEAALRRAVAINPTSAALAALGRRAAQRREIPEAIALFRQSLTLEPSQPEVLYQLTLAYGVSRDIVNARATALQLSRVAPDYPGLPKLLEMLNLPGSRP